MELVGFWSFCLNFIAGCPSCCLDVNCLQPSLVFSLRMLQRFWIRSRSGENGGHTVSCSPSCHEMQSRLLQKAQFIFLPWKKVVSQELHIHFRSFSHLQGPVRDRPAPCWHHSLVGRWWPSTSRPPLHPSGPSRVAHGTHWWTTLFIAVVVYILFVVVYLVRLVSA